MEYTSKVVVVLMVITCLGLGAFRGAEAGVACNEVVQYLMPCVSYVLNGGEVAKECCTGIKTLYGKAKSASDRRGVCTCIKNSIKGITYKSKNLALAAGLPDKCRVSIPYAISPNTDCNSVK